MRPTADETISDVATSGTEMGSPCGASGHKIVTFHLSRRHARGALRQNTYRRTLRKALMVAIRGERTH